jgi:hypothetical protein
MKKEKKQHPDMTCNEQNECELKTNHQPDNLNLSETYKMLIQNYNELKKQKTELSKRILKTEGAILLVQELQKNKEA